MQLLAVLALFLTLPALCAAQADAPVAKPDVRVGDRWVYRHTDRRMKPPTAIFEIRVSFVDARAIHAVVEPQGGKRESDATWTRDWNNVVAVDEGVFEIEKAMLQFPFTPGQQYQAAWDIRRPRAGAFHVRHERTVKVVGWEEVEVPAGKFRALKILAEGTYRRIDKPFSDKARNTYWYVPQVKRWVKTVYWDPQLEVVEELYYYRVQ